jgi:Sigma-54 interaction domain
MRTLNLVESSAKFRALPGSVDLAGPVNSAVLIQGETGTCTEVIARAIHVANSKRRNRFVARPFGLRCLYRLPQPPFDPRLRKFVIIRDIVNQEFVIPLVFKEILFGSVFASMKIGMDHRLCRYRGRAWKRIDVLKIQRTANGVTVIALSGRMETEHIVELERLLEAEPPGRRIVLDLKHLTLAGQSEIDFFAQCEGRGVTLANCAPYIREWIASQRNGKQSNDF